jgi:hypothetical protein
MPKLFASVSKAVMRLAFNQLLNFSSSNTLRKSQHTSYQNTSNRMKLNQHQPNKQFSSMHALLGAYPGTSRTKYEQPDSVLQELIKENVAKCLD